MKRKIFILFKVKEILLYSFVKYIFINLCHDNIRTIMVLHIFRAFIDYVF